jgi:hypothetical protein
MHLLLVEGAYSLVFHLHARRKKNQYCGWLTAAQKTAGTEEEVVNDQ